MCISDISVVAVVDAYLTHISCSSGGCVSQTYQLYQWWMRISYISVVAVVDVHLRHISCSSGGCVSQTYQL